MRFVQINRKGLKGMVYRPSKISQTTCLMFFCERRSGGRPHLQTLGWYFSARNEQNQILPRLSDLIWTIFCIQISFSDAILFGEWLGRKKFSSVRQMSRKLLSFNPSQRMLDEAGSHVSDHPMRDARVLSQQYIRSLMSDCSNLTKQDLSKMLDL